MKISYMDADLFQVMDDLRDRNPVAAHCIAADFGMSGGIAKQFVERMDMRNKLKAWAKKQGHHARPNPYGSYGDSYVGIMHRAIKVDNVYNLITKQWTYERPTDDDLAMALDSLKADMVAAGDKLLVIPKLGCGIDGLSWNVVRKLIIATFQPTDIEVLVCIPGLDSMTESEAWMACYGTSYKGYQGEPLPGKAH